MEINDILVRKQDISLQLWESSFIINNGKLWLPMKSKEIWRHYAREGEEEEVLEVSPGVNMELDASGKLIGVEIFRASMQFKDVIKQMEKRLQVA